MKDGLEFSVCATAERGLFWEVRTEKHQAGGGWKGTSLAGTRSCSY